MADLVKEVQMDRATVLAKVPANLHATCDALAAEGVDWAMIWIIVRTILEALLKIQPPMFGASSCPDHAKKAVEEACCAAGEAYLKALCACHCCGCELH